MHNARQSTLQPHNAVSSISKNHSNQNQTGPLAELAIIVVLVVFPFARMRTAFILLAGTMESTRSNAAKKFHMLPH